MLLALVDFDYAYGQPIPFVRATMLCAMRNAVISAISVLIVTMAPASAESIFPNDRLIAQGDLLGLCNRFIYRADQNLCQLRVTGAIHRRRVAASSIVPAQRSSMPQTRSGVLFNEGINRLVVQVSEDHGFRTTVRLSSGESCTAWAADPYMTLSAINDARAIETFLRVYLDVANEPPATKVTYFDDAVKPSVAFESTGVRAVYIRDRAADAAIWAACKGNSADTLAKSSNAFFASIVGSARHY